MIRIIQNKLIIPRGDTGNFSLPVSSTASSNDIAVFTIIDPKTKKYILQKQITPENDVLNIRLEHVDTVNLLEGRYVWDVKYYQNAVFDDEVLVSGDEVDSYYAAYDLPECEIRMTGDALLCADDNADSKLSAQSINFLQASVNEAISAKADAIIAQAAAEGAADATTQMANELADLITTTEQARTNANTAATNTQTVIQNANAVINEANEAIAAANTATTNANQAAQAVQGMSVTAQTTAAGSEATVEKQVDEHGAITLAFGIPRGDKGEKGDPGDPVDLSGKADIILTSASGSPASFSDGADGAKITSLVVDIKPVQDLHGYDYPWPAGGGKNKLPFAASKTINGVTFDINTDGSISVSGTATAIAALDIGRDNTILPVGQYYAYASAQGEINVTIFKIVDNTATVLRNGEGPFTIEEDTSVFMRLTVPVGTTVDKIVYPQIEVGSAATDYAPYSNICPIVGWNGVNVARTGVNIWDEEWESGGINQTTGQNAGNASMIRAKNYISICPNTEYFIKAPANTRAFWYDLNRNYISTFSIGTAHLFTTPNYAHYMRFIVGNSTIPVSTYNDNVSINYPSTDTEYHAYEGDTYTATFPQTVYGGTVDLVSGVGVIDKAVVDLGTLAWSYSSSYPMFYAKVPSMKTDSNKMGICENYHQVNAWVTSDTWASNDKIFTLGGSDSSVRIKDTAYTDVASFKDAMNGVQFVYELAEPVTYQLEPQDVTTLLGDNNIWADTGNVATTYRADTKRYIDAKIAKAIAEAMQG